MRESQQTSVQSGPRITLARALRAENLRLRHSRLIPLHLVCALGAGITCGTYFAISPWDPAMGSDAFVQLLGAMMPLMAGIICGLDADAEGTDTAYANLLAMPSRIRIFTARVGTLWLRGALALALAVSTFAVILLLAGRQTLGLEAWAGAIAGLAFGSIPLYILFYVLALRWDRNTAIVVGAIGLLLALFSVGGLAHGLVTGELTSARISVLSFLPTSWAALLGSLPLELAIAQTATGLAAAGHVTAVLGIGLCGCLATSLVFSVLAGWWFSRFEARKIES
ncbi:MAG: lantibiotic ABC transporter permease [Mobiluncus porci]|uniref:lantibiotic ABC transporter permease n=1 Tax=Mobiluncus porci TaxID=2652278 RepID=UPI0023F18DA1|nr:lantibiotic ABC transporter permease [Mobiluncus porci]MDD7541570.1 lantibiotic ABC transporter permease [Mobiluncus porci]MDY5748555.1 lantibiotic ABC transporter permease [Mobiluncus porci]